VIYKNLIKRTVTELQVDGDTAEQYPFLARRAHDPLPLDRRSMFVQCGPPDEGQCRSISRCSTYLIQCAICDILRSLQRNCARTMWDPRYRIVCVVHIIFDQEGPLVWCGLRWAFEFVHRQKG
jgi:hypothetical protein